MLELSRAKDMPHQMFLDALMCLVSFLCKKFEKLSADGRVQYSSVLIDLVLMVINTGNYRMPVIYFILQLKILRVLCCF